MANLKKYLAAGVLAFGICADSSSKEYSEKVSLLKDMTSFSLTSTNLDLAVRFDSNFNFSIPSKVHESIISSLKEIVADTKYEPWKHKDYGEELGNYSEEVLNKKGYLLQLIFNSKGSLDALLYRNVDKKTGEITFIADTRKGGFGLRKGID